jgi:CRISPR-associated protein Csm5
MSFVVDEKAGKLITFDPFVFMQSLTRNDREVLSTICRKGTVTSIFEVYKFMRNREFPGAAVAFCPGFLDHYRTTLSIPQHDARRIQRELSSFTIARTAFTLNCGRPYIPGSSIKGALRTAYLNARAATMNNRAPSRMGARSGLEEGLLDGGKFDSDPFRMLKVSDFMPVGEVQTRIVYAVNRKRKPSRFEARGPHQILEIVEPGTLFEGWISVEGPESGSGIRRPLSFDAILKSSNFFFEKEMNRENEDLKNIGVEPVKLSRQENGLLIRVGRHSGAECVTIDGFRSIKIMQGGGKGPKYENHATTLWLAANSRKPETNKYLRPFGWAALKPVSKELERNLLRLEEEYHQKLQSASMATSMSPTEKPIQAEEAKETAVAATMEVKPRETWTGASLVWSPGNQVLTASHQGKKATATGKGIVPETLGKRLFEKKKSVTATVEVEPVGNAFSIVTIKAEN